MSREPVRQTAPDPNQGPIARRFLRGNTMAFPRELREAIPELPTCVGRVLQLDSMTGQAGAGGFFTPPVALKLVVKETGKLKGEYVIGMTLQVDAARALAENLRRLADQAEKAGAN